MKAAHCYSCTLALMLVLGCGADAEEPADPAERIVAGALSPEDQQRCREFFRTLAHEDFDTRQAALSALLSRGFAVLPVAREFESDAEPEVAEQARGFKTRLIFSYDGYLPTAPRIKEALNRKFKFSNAGRQALGTFIPAAAAATQIAIVIDPSARGFMEMPAPELDTDREAEFSLAGYCAFLGMQCVPRGDCLVVARGAVAAKLAMQRHTFGWSSLGLTRDSAECVRTSLVPLLPPGTELHASAEALSVRGSEESIARAARLIALLGSETASAIWPAAPPAGLPALRSKLEAPVSIALASEEPLNALSQLKRQGHAVSLVLNTEDGKTWTEAPFPEFARGAAPLRLSLREMPLGMALRWLERRVRFVSEQQNETILGYEFGPGQRLQFRVQLAARQAAEAAVAGTDISFLYPLGTVPGVQSDASVLAKIVPVLTEHLAAFPALNPGQNIAVVRGRLLLQGHPATLAQALALLHDWKTRGDAVSAPWRQALDRILDTPLAWTGQDSDGRKLTGGRMLPLLRKLSRANILIEDDSDGKAAAFQLTPEDAQLLPPGQRTLRALLDNLAARVHAAWHLELGAIVLKPASTPEVTGK